MRVELSRLIEADLDTIAEYIAQDSPAPAVSFIREIRGGSVWCDRNLALPAQAGNRRRCAMALVSRYAILFRIIGDVVRIERVV
jgi:toxin ParE1/3/4